MLESVVASYLVDGYAKKRGLDGWYRDLTVREAKKAPQHLFFSSFSSASVDAKDWFVCECRRNGAAKTWKTFPGCELPLVYGWKNYFRVGDKLLPEDAPISRRSNKRIVVPVRQSFLPDTPPGIVLDWVLENELELFAN